MLMDADGLPIDVGLHAAPLVTDWDGDGIKDLLVGAYENCVVLYRNAGSNRDRKLVYKRFIDADGQPLALPTRPVPARPEAIFKRDYHPTLERVDWNGDGRLDLLAGGYVTGRVFLYENTVNDGDGSPRLTARGPLLADGKPLNVGDWCAAPCAADFNGDGKLDLITGRLPMSTASAAGFLRYFENVGTPSEPVLAERPFPKQGEFPRGSLTVPRAADWNDDGLPDLVVSARQDIYLFPNVGTPSAPKFDVSSKPLRGAWNNADLPTRQFLDWNSDGWPDYVSGYQVHLNAKAGNPYRFDEVVNVLPPGVIIAHPSGIGDDWYWPYLADLDKDGKIDVLFGDWHGTIWFHRNTSGDGSVAFDTAGYRLKTKDGKELKVGPMGADIEKDFTALQGARTVFAAADFDGDARCDLVVGDTYGKIRYYRNVGPRDAPAFEPAVEVGDVRVRLHVDAADWNGDGKMDVVAGTSGRLAKVFLNVGRQGNAEFDEGHNLNLPPIVQPRTVMVDMNRDGDHDLFIRGTQGSALVERSFLEHGYAIGRVLAVEKKTDRPE
jgi:hypothetical protein